MPHASATSSVTHAVSQDHQESSQSRPAPSRQDTTDILEYYNSATAAGAYSGPSKAQAHSSSRHRPSTAPHQSSDKVVSENVQGASDDLARQTSIRLVPSSSKSQYPEALPRPALHHADSNLLVTSNRKIAIIERDGTPAPGSGPGSGGISPVSPGSTSPSILARRGVERSRLALVSPPDAAPSSQSIQSSPPSAAAFALSKSSRAKYADVRASPTTPNEGQSSYYSNHAHSHHSHGRSSSEATAIAGSHNTRSPTGMGTAHYTEAPKSPRDVGIVGTMRTMAGRPELDNKAGSRHRRRQSSGNASSGSDYGDEPTLAKSSDVSAHKPSFSPVFQNPRQDAPSSQHVVGAGSASSNSHGMHLPLPAVPRTFGSSSNHTPLLTPAIGDGKPIDFKVAAPVVVDIRSDLADLWLAATPDRDLDFNSAGSPMTAMTTTTDSSSHPTSLSPVSSGQSSVTSPLKTRTQHYDPVFDAKAGPVPVPPRHIDVNSLASGSSPICPPRPQRQPSPAKRPTPLGGDSKSSSSSSIASQMQEFVTPPSDPTTSDPKYALLAVSDDESGSDYSNNQRTRKTSRSYSAAAGSTRSKSGSIHIREGAFPANSVFLHRLKTDVDAEPLDSEMKTPTNNNKLANMFTVENAQAVPMSDASSRRRKDSIASSKASGGRRSNEVSRKTRPSTADSRGIAETTAAHGEALSHSQSKEVEAQLNIFTWEGSLTHGRESPTHPVPDSPTNSTSMHHANPHSHLGHGPPPTGRSNYVKGPSVFKAKGPLATSGTVRSAPKPKEIHINPPGQWPAAMSFADVLSEPTPLARAIGYAMKINELSKEDCGLGLWIEEVLSKTRPPVMTSSGPVPVGPSHTRFVSGNSAMSEMTFPIRPDAYKAIDLTPSGTEISATELPSSLPYPVLALSQQLTGNRPAVPPIPPAKSSISSAVKSGSANFLATFGRRASVKGRGSQSGSAGEGKEKEPRSTPRKLVSARGPPSRNGDTTPPSSSTPSRSNTLLPLIPTLPGGPRAPRPKRSSTMMIGPPKPIISAPIPITPGPVSTSSSNAYPDSNVEIDRSDSPTDLTPQPMTLTKEVPRAPEGPRPQNRLTRTPSFPGSARISASGISRSVVSFKPSASPLATQMSGSRSAVGAGTQASSPRGSQEFSRDLDKLCDVLPHVPRDTLAIYLSRAEGRSMLAIGRYLEDERQGTVQRP